MKLYRQHTFEMISVLQIIVRVFYMQAGGAPLKDKRPADSEGFGRTRGQHHLK